MGRNIPISGGYGEDKHMLVAEYPGHLLRAASKARTSNLAVSRMLSASKK